MQTTLGLQGVTVTSFDAAAQAGFTAALASSVNVPASSVSIVSFAALGSRRRRNILQGSGGISVAVSLAVDPSADASSLAAAVTVATSGAGAGSLTTALQAVPGLSSLATMTVLSPAVVAVLSAQPPMPPSPP